MSLCIYIYIYIYIYIKVFSKFFDKPKNFNYIFKINNSEITEIKTNLKPYRLFHPALTLVSSTLEELIFIQCNYIFIYVK